MNESKELELIKKFGIDVAKLRSEQNKLRKSVILKDSHDFSQVEFIGGFSNLVLGKEVLSVCVVLNRQGEVIDQKYFLDKASFPYIPEFRAYRELPMMLACLELLKQRPEVVFIEGVEFN